MPEESCSIYYCPFAFSMFSQLLLQRRLLRGERRRGSGAPLSGPVEVL